MWIPLFKCIVWQKIADTERIATMGGDTALSQNTGKSRIRAYKTSFFSLAEKIRVSSQVYLFVTIVMGRTKNNTNVK